MSYINNMNPRRMIWFNQNAPKNKMDLWLSYNRHYEDTSEDETTDPQQTTDNPNLRKCDLILKAWDCGKWIPIVGFNTTAANKIDTVTGTLYTPPGETNPHNGKTLYHPAVFTDESPNELFDWGSLGDMLKSELFVTKNDWGSIYNTRIKNLVIQDIDVDIDPATDSLLGGIYASRFGSNHVSGLDNYPYIAKCCYKFLPVHSTNPDYHLFVHARDIIDAINNYTTLNPGEPGILPGSDFDLWLATTSKIGGIKSDIHSYYGLTSAFKPVECKFYPNQGSWSSLHERLCINARDVIDTFINSFDDEFPYFLGGPGIELDQVPGHSAITWKIVGLSNALNGQYPRCRIGSSGPTLEWVDSIDTWRPIQINSTPITGINTLNIAEGSGVTIETVVNNGVTTATISADSTPSPITITEGEGIDVTTTLSGYEVGINLTGATLGKVLSYNGTNVVWANPQAGSYTAGTGVLINLLSSTISSEILIDSNNYTASNTATFNCVWGDLSTPSGIKMVLDGSDSNAKILEPFTYTKLTWDKVNSGSISFNVGEGSHNLKIYTKGDPIFIELDLSDASNQIISVNFNNGHYIDVNGAILNGYFNGSYFLITVQFGIVKIELMN